MYYIGHGILEWYQSDGCSFANNVDEHYAYVLLWDCRVTCDATLAKNRPRYQFLSYHSAAMQFILQYHFMRQFSSKLNWASSRRRRSSGWHDPDSSRDQIQCFSLGEVWNVTNIMREYFLQLIINQTYVTTADFHTWKGPLKWYIVISYIIHIYIYIYTIARYIPMYGKNDDYAMCKWAYESVFNVIAPKKLLKVNFVKCWPNAWHKDSQYHRPTVGILPLWLLPTGIWPQESGIFCFSETTTSLTMTIHLEQTSHNMFNNNATIPLFQRHIIFSC